MNSSSTILLRPGRDADAQGFITLIGDCWADYPGCILDLEREEKPLFALASYYAAGGGALWTAEQDGKVVGMVATRPLGQDRAFEICRMYVAKAAHGSGLAQRLLAMAEAHAVAAGAERLVLWTDTRFDRAHRFYEKQSYVRQGAIRILDDLSKSLEFRYAKPARGLQIEALDAAAAASAEARLAEILIGCVDAGASVHFLPPLARDTARDFWRKVTTAVAGGGRLLLGAWQDGVLAGTVQLDMAMPQNQPHRAEVVKLLVHPDHRRRGIGRALMQRVEQAAARHGKRLLVLDTASGDAGEQLYRSLDWQEAGRIPRFCLMADGSYADTVLFWKELP